MAGLELRIVTQKSELKNKCITGKPVSEALIFAEHRENTLCTYIVLNVKNNFCTQHVLPMFWAWNCHVLNNLLSYCGLVDAKIRASDKDFFTKIVCSSNWVIELITHIQSKSQGCLLVNNTNWKVHEIIVWVWAHILSCNTAI